MRFAQGSDVISHVLKFERIPTMLERRKHSLICKVWESGFVKSVQSDYLRKFYCAFMLKKFETAYKMYTLHQKEIDHRSLLHGNSMYSTPVISFNKPNCWKYIIALFTQTRIQVYETLKQFLNICFTESSILLQILDFRLQNKSSNSIAIHKIMTQFDDYVKLRAVTRVIFNRPPIKQNLEILRILFSYTPHYFDQWTDFTHLAMDVTRVQNRKLYVKTLLDLLIHSIYSQNIPFFWPLPRNLDYLIEKAIHKNMSDIELAVETSHKIIRHVCIIANPQIVIHLTLQNTMEASNFAVQVICLSCKKCDIFVFFILFSGLKH